LCEFDWERWKIVKRIMKDRFYFLLKTYALFILLFVIQKPLFMLYYHDLYHGCSFMDYLLVMWHGLPLDASISGYLTVLPGLFLIASLWFNSPIIKWIFKVYYGIVAMLLGLIFVSDIILYKYWGFRLDSTPLFYLKTPKDAFASADLITILLGLFAVIVVISVFFFLFYHFLLKPGKKIKKPFCRKRTSLILLFLTGFLFIPIRGGFSVSTMNVGWAYFSDKIELNHAAVNPCFSLMESLSREQSFEDQYRFMKDNEAATQFAKMKDQAQADSIPSLLTTKNPNVIFIVLESFMSKVIQPLGGLPDVTPSMNRFCNEGILFTNFYANSFRTDRGLVSILSGYPAQPTTSIMKYPQRSQSLPSISKSLKKAGYSTEYYYGGDANFTNMRSYLLSQGYDRIVCDKDFPLIERMSKWGAPDQYLFNRASSDLAGAQKEPFFKTIQTSSSHEPFDVPSHKFKEPYLNSVFYVDSCLGKFIDQYKKTKYWKNTVIVLVADHAMHYPASITNHNVERFQIPLIIMGGAVKKPLKVDTYASQIDIAATLLYQLGLPHKEFTFSKNILNTSSPHFGYFTYPNGFGMATPQNQMIFDCEANKVVLDLGKKKSANLIPAKAYLQTLYDDLSKR